MTNIWMPIYWGDYFRDTFHLSAEEHGAYFLLMGYYWQNGKIPRDLDLIKNITKLSEKKLSRVMRFFRVEGLFYIHDRIEKELTEAAENKDKRAKKAKAAADARWGNNDAPSNATSIPQVLLEECPSPPPSPPPDSLNNNPPTPLGKGFEKKDWDIICFLSPKGLANAKRAAPGWDIYNLAKVYNQGVADRGIPETPDLAFAGWCKKYTKGKQL